MSNFSDPSKSVYRVRDFWVLYVLIFLFVILKYFFPGMIFPDGLNLRETDAKDFFSGLLSTSAELLGILVAAILLSFQLLAKEAKRRKESNALHNPWVIGFACLSLFLIAGLTFGYVTVASFEKDNDLSIGYFLLYTFLAFIILLFFVVHILLSYTNALHKARKTISTLTIPECNQAERAYYDGTWITAPHLKLSTIRDEVLYAIRDNDNGALHTLLTDLTSRAAELITPQTERKNCEAVIKALTMVWHDATATTSNSRNPSFYETVSDCVSFLYHHAASNKIPLLYYHDLRTYYSKLAEQFVRTEDMICLRKMLDVLGKGFSIHVNHNCPKENVLPQLMKLFQQTGGMHNTDAAIQWDDINDFIYDISRIQQLSIDHELKDLYIDCRRKLLDIVSHLEHGDFPDLGKFQRAFILIEIITLRLLFNGEKALNLSMFEDTLETYRLEGSMVADIIEKDPFACRKILKTIGDHLINMRRKGKLNVWMTMNEFGSIPRHTVDSYRTNQMVQNATRYIFEVFKKMKEEIEVTGLPAEIKTYEEIKSQLAALSRSLKEKESYDGEILLRNEVEECLDTFKDVTATPDFNIIPWPSSEK